MDTNTITKNTNHTRNSTNQNNINQNTINTNNNVNQINTNINQRYDKDRFVIYNPYLINSPIPKIQDLLQFLKVKELDINNPNVQKCFNYLQEYDPQNCLLLDNLEEQYKMIKKYCDEHNKKPYYNKAWKINYSELKYGRKINEELVRKIINTNINVAQHELLQKFKYINTRIYDIYSYFYNNQNLYDKTYSELSRYINDSSYYSCNETQFFGSDQYNKLINNCYLRQNNYYKRYANILWKDISKIISKVFEK